MGYSTYFDGEFTVTPPLTPAHREYLEAFRDTRRMKRNPLIADTFPDPLRVAVGLPVGDGGQYCVGSNRLNSGQDHDASILDYNKPPHDQPGLWCQWVPSEDGSLIVWDEGEKFYNYTEWLKYIIAHFLRPWGYKLSGTVSWQGDDDSDRGVIYARDYDVEEVCDTIGNAGPSWEREPA